MIIFIAGNVGDERENRVINHGNENRLLSFYYLKGKDDTLQLYKKKFKKGELKLHEDK